MTTYVLPGMGATSEMYQGPWRELTGFVFLDWPESFVGENLAELAADLISQNQMIESDRVIGSSLGGMVACEISNQIGSTEIMLIGSAISPQEISGLLKILHPLIDLTPVGLIGQLAGKIPAPLSTMFAESDPHFIRKMCRAIWKWEGLKNRNNLRRVHGSNDHVIPCPENAEVIKGGGHLIAMTHAKECIRALKL